jgi:transcriptional regulator
MSLYTPALFRAEPDFGWKLAADHPFALLIVPPEPLVSPIPFVVDREARVLIGHVARANPIASRIDGARATVVFQGPHAYVSPRWYTQPAAQVPTWNYVSAVLSGTARALDRDALAAMLERLAETFEPDDGWRTSMLDPTFFDGLLRGIVGFSIAVDHIDAKQKLSQNRSPEDRAGVIEGLAGAGEDDLVARMRAIAPEGER